MADGTFAAADARKRVGFRSMAGNNFYCLPMEPTWALEAPSSGGMSGEGH